jgi:hypothetical protein
MAILRGLSSHLLQCGCLVGIYETYDGNVVTILDARGPQCAIGAHVTDQPVAAPPQNALGTLESPADLDSGQ